jgi:hypothetical protein
LFKGLSREILVVQETVSNVWWDKIKMFASPEYPFLSHFHRIKAERFPGVLEHYFSLVANVQNMMREPQPGSERMTKLGKTCMRSIGYEGTKEQWADLDLFLKVLHEEGWLPSGCRACTFREVYGQPEAVYHVDYLMTAGSFLTAIVVEATTPYTLKFLKNPILDGATARTEANPKEIREKELQKGSIYCLSGAILAVPHCPVPQDPNASRKVFLIGGHITADLTSGKTENLHKELTKHPMYYHFTERRGNAVPRNAEWERVQSNIIVLEYKQNSGRSVT